MINGLREKSLAQAGVKDFTGMYNVVPAPYSWACRNTYSKGLRSVKILPISPGSFVHAAPRVDTHGKTTHLACRSLFQ